MIKEALEYIVGMSKPTIEVYDDEHFSDRKLYQIRREIPVVERPIELHTLTGLLDYVYGNKDNLDFLDLMVIVDTPTDVRLCTGLNENRERETLVKVSAMVPAFKFNSFINHEEFCIQLQSKFLDTEDRAIILKFAGTVENGTVAQYGDDGVSQKATVKTGIVSKSDAIVPNPIRLMPYRTFHEVGQPESSFVFRMRDSHGDVECAIFEADGGAWKQEGMKNVHEFLTANLSDYPNITVIA